MHNVFFRNNDITFQGKLKTFIKENNYGYYMDIYVPESYVTKLMIAGITPMYIEDGIKSGFILRCRIWCSAIIMCNGIRLNYLSKELAEQTDISPDNTRIKSLELESYSNMSNRPRTNNDAQCSVLRGTFKTEVQKLPKEF